jgi:NADH-quinone oxidoreductase subunit G
MKERNPNHHFTVAFTPFTSDVLKQTTDLLIPIGTTFETSGTFVNCEGRLQSFIRAANPVEESRAGWRVISSILRELNPETTIFKSSEEIRDYVNQLLGKIILDNSLSHNESIKDYHDNSVYAENAEVPMYQIDGLVRRAKSLQLTPEGLRHSGNAE